MATESTASTISNAAVTASIMASQALAAKSAIDSALSSSTVNAVSDALTKEEEEKKKQETTQKSKGGGCCGGGCCKGGCCKGKSAPSTCNCTTAAKDVSKMRQEIMKQFEKFSDMYAQQIAAQIAPSVSWQTNAAMVAVEQVAKKCCSGKCSGLQKTCANTIAKCCGGNSVSKVKQTIKKAGGCCKAAQLTQAYMEK